MKLAFDNAMYLELQSKKIKERLNQFGTNSEESFLTTFMLPAFFPVLRATPKSKP